MEVEGPLGEMRQLSALDALAFSEDDYAYILAHSRAQGAIVSQALMRVSDPRATLLKLHQHLDKFIIADDTNLKHRAYPAARGRQTILLNRDIIRLFPGLRVSDSFLMKNNIREILFRKPSYETR